MRKLIGVFLAAVFVSFLWIHPIDAQERKGSITGHVTDINHDPLVGARVTLEPLGNSTATDAQGQFTIADLLPNKYTLTISYVGFKTFSKEVTVTSGTAANVDAVLEIETVNEEVIVRGERERGEVEALNRERTADNIVQVLPADVITSLPNTNIADAVGRLPSVSLERDEGEGKYVQIRGTEPRLSNVTIDGVHVPSPEGVRNVKLDAIPADLIDSVEINKTLSASQEGDAIGGSVNLVTKKPTDQPFISLNAMGGFTPISGGRTLDQFGGTYGKRFGTEHKFGFLLGASFDHNNRGIDDLEPVPDVHDFSANQDGSDFRPVFLGTDNREYWYDRTRFGFAGSADYRLGKAADVYVHGLFSQFYDNGDNWNYSTTVGNFTTDPSTTDATGSIGMNHFHRDPQQQIYSVTAGANHTIGSSLLTYEFSGGRAEYQGGFPFASWSGPSGIQFGVDTSNPHTPKFPVVNGVNIFDPAAYTLSFIIPWDDHIRERDYTGSITFTHPYTVGSRLSVLEVGFKARDADKVRTGGRQFLLYTGAPFPLSSALKTVPNYTYYFGAYKLGPLSDWSKIQQFVNANSSQFPDDPASDHITNDPNQYDTSERVLAGYVMDTITLGRVRLQGGVRFEGTQGSFVGNQVLLNTDGTWNSTVPVPGEQTYVDVLPSIQFQYTFGSNTNLRLAYGRGIARPNFSDLPPFAVVDPSSGNVTLVSKGNPNLKPTHANDFDILFEHYLKSVGIIQAGWFYKALTDPIYSVTTVPTNGQFAGDRVTQPINGPSAHITGVEMAWEQHLTRLPGMLNGTGVSANYSYTTSQASFPADFGRTDHPALLRQAPNNWNFDVTYDKGPISARMGLTHNDANIFSYIFQDGAPLGIKGPKGDQYLFPHTQVDAQASYRIPHAHGIQAVVSLLNLTNETFGFYFGSEQYPIQREYYSRTISAGLRWTNSNTK
jgi:TonB-dependent receptor